MIREILRLGDARLYETSSAITIDDLPQIKTIAQDLRDTMLDFRARYKKGRAIAAPQIGAFKRVIYMEIDKPVVFINPSISFDSDEQFIVMDDCMSFPKLLVRVKRYKSCTITYKNLEWQDQSLRLEGDLSELLQHEYDHLDGILATMRAIDDKSFFMEM